MTARVGTLGPKTPEPRAPEAASAVEASHANGLALQVSSTPTIFINGRRIVGADPHLVEQNIKYELDQQKTAKH